MYNIKNFKVIFIAIFICLFITGIATAGFTTEVYGKGIITSKTTGYIEGGTNLHKFGTTEGSYNIVAGHSSFMSNGLASVDKTSDMESVIDIQTEIEATGQFLAHDSVGMINSLSAIPGSLCDPSLAIADATSTTPTIQYPNYQTLEGQVGTIGYNGKYQSTVASDGVNVNLRSASEFESGISTGNFRGTIEQGIDENSSTLNYESSSTAHDMVTTDRTFTGKSAFNYNWVFGDEFEDSITTNETTNQTLNDRINSTADRADERTD